MKEILHKHQLTLLRLQSLLEDWDGTAFGFHYPSFKRSYDQDWLIKHPDPGSLKKQIECSLMYLDDHRSIFCSAPWISVVKILQEVVEQMERRASIDKAEDLYV